MRATDAPQLRHRIRRAQNPIAPGATAARPPSAVSSLGGFRTPARGVRGTDTHRPASETLHRSRLSRIEYFDHLAGALCLQLLCLRVCREDTKLPEQRVAWVSYRVPHTSR